MDPQGVHIASFQAPTPEERRHGFLWRIRRELPGAGIVGVFDRSHYEDVLAVRVRRLAPRSTWSRRFGVIDRFERELAGRGVRIVKCLLHVSPDEARERLLARLDDPTKHWKYDPGDVETLALWDDYLDAYEDAIERCNTEVAPWFLVPADRKWYRNWAITTLLIEQLEEMELRWPAAAFDVEEQRGRLRKA
jgi:PPK2 family polyphosphate:nucleotide phosphotransferase